MSYNVLPLFSTPVYHSGLIINDNDRECIHKLEFNRLSVDNGDMSTNTRVLDLPEFADLKKSIEIHLDVYTKQVLHIKQEFYLTNSWVMRHQKGDWSQSHTHTNSIFSGVVYVDSDERSGKFIISRNYVNLVPSTLTLDYSEWNTYNSGTWSLSPVSNQIIIFPSTMNHSVTKCESENLRYSLAFNAFVKGRLGGFDPTNVSQLDL